MAVSAGQDTCQYGCVCVCVCMSISRRCVQSTSGRNERFTAYKGLLVHWISYSQYTHSGSEQLQLQLVHTHRCKKSESE
jgi:hypothetical protein